MKAIISMIIILLTISIFTSVYAKTFAQVKDNKVINVFDWSDNNNPVIAGHTFVDVTAITKPKVNDTYDGVNFTTPATIIPPAVRIISSWAFRQRLTSAEKQALSTSTNAIVVTVADDIRSMGNNINLDDSGLIADMDALVTAGLITAGRKTAILQ